MMRLALALSAASAARVAPPQPEPPSSGTELLPQGDFGASAVSGGGGGLPAHWDVVCANNATCPSFAHTTHAGDAVLLASGSGRAETYGWAETNVTAPLRVGQSYCLRAELGYEGLVDLQRHTRIELNGPGYLSGLFEYDRPCAGALSAEAAASCRSSDDKWVKGSKRFTYGWPSPMSSSNGTGTVRLYLKYTPHGRVWWRKVSLTECEPAPKRPPVRPPHPCPHCCPSERSPPTLVVADVCPGEIRLWSLRSR